MNAFEPSTTQSPFSNRPGRMHLGRVGAGAGLGQSEPAERLAASERREPALLLLVGPEPVQQVAGEPDRRRQRDRDRLVDPPELLERETHRDRVGVGSPVRLGERQPEQPEVAHLLHHVERELLLPVGLGRPRRDDLVQRTRGRPRGTPLVRRSDRSSCLPEALDVQDGSRPLRRHDGLDASADLPWAVAEQAMHQDGVGVVELDEADRRPVRRAVRRRCRRGRS